MSDFDLFSDLQEVAPAAAIASAPEPASDFDLFADLAGAAGDVDDWGTDVAWARNEATGERLPTTEGSQQSVMGIASDGDRRAGMTAKKELAAAPRNLANMVKTVPVNVVAAVDRVPALARTTLGGMMAQEIDDRRQRGSVGIAESDAARNIGMGWEKQGLSDYQEKLRIQDQIDLENFDRDTTIGKLASGTSRSIAEMIPGTAAVAATGGAFGAFPALAYMGLNTGAMVNADLRLDGVSRESAQRAMIVSGVAEAGFEAISPLKTLFDVIGVKTTLKQFGQNIILENATEIPTGAVQQSADLYYRLKDTSGEEQARSSVVAYLSGQPVTIGERVYDIVADTAMTVGQTTLQTVALGALGKAHNIAAKGGMFGRQAQVDADVNLQQDAAKQRMLSFQADFVARTGRYATAQEIEAALGSGQTLQQVLAERSPTEQVDGVNGNSGSNGTNAAPPLTNAQQPVTADQIDDFEDFETMPEPRGPLARAAAQVVPAVPAVDPLAPGQDLPSMLLNDSFEEDDNDGGLSGVSQEVGGAAQTLPAVRSEDVAAVPLTPVVEDPYSLPALGSRMAELTGDAESPENAALVDEFLRNKGNWPNLGTAFRERLLTEFVAGKKAARAKLDAVNPVAATPLDALAHEAATSPANDKTEPTLAQIEAGNYAKGHISLHGLNIAIENPAGSARKGVDETGRAWETQLTHHYGYIKGTLASDGDHVDVFVKPGIDQTTAGSKVFVVDQKDLKSGQFDESKVMIGFPSAAAAREAYLSNYDRQGPERILDVSVATVEGFKLWLKTADTTKPFSPNALMAAKSAPLPSSELPKRLINYPSLARAAKGLGLTLSTRNPQGFFVVTDADKQELGRTKSLEEVAELLEARRNPVTAPALPAPKVKTAKQLAAQKARNTINPASDDLLMAIRKLGGLDKAQVLAQWGKSAVESSYLQRSALVGKPVLRKKAGLPLDRMLSSLKGHGYLPQDASLTDFEELFLRSAAGAAVLTDQGDERAADALYEAEMARLVGEMEASQAEELAQELDPDFASLVAGAPELAGMTPEALEWTADVFNDILDGGFLMSADDYVRSILEESDDAGNYTGRAQGAVAQAAAGTESQGSSATTTGIDTETPAAGVRSEVTPAGDQLKMFATPPTFGKKAQPKGPGVAGLDLSLAPEEAGLFDVAPSPAPTNTVFTEDAYLKARALMKGKLDQLSAGIDPELMQAGFTIAGYHIEKGARSFSAYAAAMVEDFGDKIKPYLKSFYNGVRDLPGIEAITGEMDSYAVVAGVDVAELGKVDGKKILPRNLQRDREAFIRFTNEDLWERRRSYMQADRGDGETRFSFIERMAAQDAGYRKKARKGDSHLHYLDNVEVSKIEHDYFEHLITSEINRKNGIRNPYYFLSGEKLGRLEAELGIPEEADFDSYTSSGYLKYDNYDKGYIEGLKGEDSEKQTAKSQKSAMLPVTKENNDVERISPDLERNRRNAEAADAVGGEDLRTQSGEDAGSGLGGVESDDGGGFEFDGGLLLPETAAAPPRKRGNQSLRTSQERSGTADVPAGSDNSERGDSFGVERVPLESIGTDAVARAALQRDQETQLKHAQLRAQSVKHAPGSENIAAMLPLLHAGQRADVLFAEERHAKPVGYGVLFTNGTGTGKTFTGLGVVKRLERQGKKNILIVVPSDKIMADWITSGQKLYLNITPLQDTKDAGREIVITTYANFGANSALAQRAWDMVVADEAHYFAQNKDGDSTNALSTLRAVTLHPQGAYDRTRMLHGDLTGQIQEAVAAKDEERVARLTKQWQDALEKVRAEVAAQQGLKRPRVTFLSATPFSYVKSVDFANGYLFDWGSDQQGGRYNSGDNRERFYMQHFGYRMRYNKLTEPDANVDQGVMQRQFNAYLKKEKVLSSRVLDVDADYDRRFVMAESAVGTMIDEGLTYLRDNWRLRPLYESISKRFDYLSRQYLLEAIKASEAVSHIEEHLALGRKVVVFHNFKKGGGFNPFAVHDLTSSPDVAVVQNPETGQAEEIRLRDAAKEFIAARRDLVNYPFSVMLSPIETLTRAFPDVMLFNGNIKKADRRRHVELFQDDNSGRNLLVVQSAAGKEGISLHDTTGKYQRVLFNLGLPTQPTMAIQQEGRIYRIGQVSNALFRYFNTGTNWERYAFASTIAGRASTAENLAMGESARALKDAFIQGFEDSDAYRAGHDGEGTGGKERDRLANAALTEWDRAVSYYFGQQKKTSRNKSEEGKDYFATPEPVGLKMVEWASLRSGESALEPSIGHGAIGRWFPDDVKKRGIEPSLELASRAALVFDGDIVNSVFEEHNIINKYDAVIMNPPFGSAGSTAIAHLAKASKHLRDGGRVVALIPTGPAADKKFDKWLYEESVQAVEPIATAPDDTPIYAGDTVQFMYNGAMIWEKVHRENGMLGVHPHGDKTVHNIHHSNLKKERVKPTGKREHRIRNEMNLVADILLPSSTFERAGTGVMTRIVVLDKSKDAPQQVSLDFSNAETIKDFFARLENISIPERRKTSEAAEDKAAADAVAVPVAGAAAPFAGVIKIVEHTTGKGKTLRGTVMHGVSKEEALKVDPYTFAKDGGFFVRDKHFNALPQGIALYDITSALPLALKQLGKLAQAGKESLPHLITVGRAVHAKGVADYKSFVAGMKAELGALFERFKGQMLRAWHGVLAKVKEERGSLSNKPAGLGRELKTIMDDLKGSPYNKDVAAVELSGGFNEDNGRASAGIRGGATRGDGERQLFAALGYGNSAVKLGEAAHAVARQIAAGEISKTDALQAFVNSVQHISQATPDGALILRDIAAHLRTLGHNIPNAGLPAIQGLFKAIGGAWQQANKADSVAENVVEYGIVEEKKGVLNDKQATFDFDALPGDGGNDRDGERSAGSGVSSLSYYRVKGQPSVARKIAADLKVRVDQVQTGTFRTGISSIQNAADAAHLFAPLRKQNREVFAVLVLDQAQRPLAVMNVSTGAHASSIVHPLQVVGPALSVPGAASLWFGHNHPSGNLHPSKEDLAITERLENVFQGTGLAVNGHILIGDKGMYGAFPFDKPNLEYPYQGKIPARVRRQEVPVLGTQFGKRLPGEESISTAKAAQDYIAGKGTGLLLLNHRNNPVGWVAFTTAEMMELRTGSRESGAGLLARAAAQANAPAALIVVEGKAQDRAADNVTAFLNAIGVNTLDILYQNTPYSRRDSGDDLEEGTHYYSVARQTILTGDSGLGKVTITPAKSLPFIGKALAKENAEQVVVKGGNVEALRKVAQGFGKNIIFFRMRDAAAVDAVGRAEGGVRLQSGGAGNATDAKRAGGGAILSADETISGFINPAQPNLIFLNVDAPNHLLYISGHEVGHALKMQDPALWAEMEAELQPLIRNWSHYRDSMPEQYGTLEESEKQEELLADVIGHHFLNENFWSELAQENKSLFTRIAKKAVELLNKALRLLTGMDVRTYISDMTQARAIIAKTLLQYGENVNKGLYGKFAEQADLEYLDNRLMGQTALEHLRAAGFSEETLRAAVGLGPAKLAAAWHGSPHDHDRFSTEKIGTGEGAQVYGYGLYFAESRNVAEHYQKMRSDYAVTVNGREYDVYTNNPDMETSALAQMLWEVDSSNKPNIDKTIARLREGLQRSFLDAAGKDNQEKQIQWLERNRENIQVGMKGGKLYQVELAPSEDEYLLWDKPLSEQSKKVKSSLLSWAEDSKRESLHEAVMRNINFPGTIKAGAIDKLKTQSTQEYFEELSEEGMNGKDFYTDLTGQEGSQEAASNYLYSLGIRGIKYLDGTSRGKGDGNYNYVIFHEDDVAITAKYAIQRAAGQVNPAGALEKIKNLLNPLDYARLRRSTEKHLTPEVKHVIGFIAQTPYWKQAEADPAAKPFYVEGRVREEERMDYNVRMRGGMLDGDGRPVSAGQKIKDWFNWNDDRTAWEEMKRQQYYPLSTAEKSALDLLVVEGDARRVEYSSLAKALQNPALKAAGVNAQVFTFYRQLLATQDRSFDIALDIEREIMEEMGWPKELIDKSIAQKRELGKARVEFTFSEDDKHLTAITESGGLNVLHQMKKIAHDFGTKVTKEKAGGLSITFPLNRAEAAKEALTHVVKNRIRGRMHRNHGEGMHNVAVHRVIEKLDFDVRAVALKSGKPGAQFYLPFYPGRELAEKIEEAASAVGGSFLQEEGTGRLLILVRDELSAELQERIDKIELRKTDGTPKHKVMVYSRYVATEAAAEKLQREVEKDFKKALPINYRTGDSYEATASVSTGVQEAEYAAAMSGSLALDHLTDEALRKAINRGDIDAKNAETLLEEFRQNLAEELMARGAGAQMIRRAPYLIEGYERADIVGNFEATLNGTAGMLSKAIYALRQFKHMQKVPALTRPWATNYIAGTLRNMGRADRLSGDARALASLWYLGFNAIWMAINHTQPFVFGVAELSRHIKGGALASGKEKGALRQITLAEKDILTGKQSPAEKALWKDPRVQVQIEETVMAEMAGSDSGVGGKFSRGLHTASRVAMAHGHKVEVLNRKMMILAAYRTFRQQGQEHGAALEQALGVNSAVNIDMGRYNLPGYAAHSSIGRTMFALQSFIQHAWQYIYYRSTSGQARDQKAILRLLFAMTLLGGLPAGAPGSDELDDLIMRLFGYSPKLAMKGWLRKAAREYDTLGELLEGFVWHGIPGMLGGSVTGNVQFRIPIISSVIAGDNAFRSVGGAVGGLATKGWNAVGAIEKGNYGRALEYAAPTFVANPLSGIRQATEGVKTSHGKPVFYKGQQLKMTKGEAAVRSMGMQPARTVDIAEVRGGRFDLQAQWNEKRQLALDRYRIGKALKHVQEFNRELRESQAAGLVNPITWESLQKQAKPDKKQTRWEREKGFE